MTVKKLGAEIVKQASWFINPDDISKMCLEVGNNRGACIEDLQKQFYGNERNEWYCTIFAWLMIDNSAKSLGITNILLKDPNGQNIIDDAKKKGIRYDQTPAVGSMFRHEKGGNSGHTGIVAWIDGDTWYTIEGNGGEVSINGKKYQGIFSYKYYKQNIKSMNYHFLHVEEMGNTGNVNFSAKPTNKYGFYITNSNISKGLSLPSFAFLQNYKVKNALIGSLIGGTALAGTIMLKNKR